jgi:hypothetical protein
MNHVLLLGDSIFDNASYVSGRPAVIAQLCNRLPTGWRATLLAVDGAVTTNVLEQVKRLPSDATHLVVSVGGNDALQYSAVIADQRSSAAEGFERLAAAQESFRSDYRAMLRAVLQRQLPTLLCTVYDAIPGLPPTAVTGLSVFNDAIIREAAANQLPVLDLRLICNQARDYSHISPIEPSEQGGAKIALHIARVLTSHDFARGQCVVYGP